MSIFTESECANLIEEVTSIPETEASSILKAPSKNKQQLQELYFNVVQKIKPKTAASSIELGELPMIDLSSSWQHHFRLQRLFVLVKTALRETQPEFEVSMSDFTRPKKSRTLDIIGNLLNVCLFDSDCRKERNSGLEEIKTLKSLNKRQELSFEKDISDRNKRIMDGLNVEYSEATSTNKNKFTEMQELNTVFQMYRATKGNVAEEICNIDENLKSTAVDLETNIMPKMELLKSQLLDPDLERITAELNDELKIIVEANVMQNQYRQSRNKKEESYKSLDVQISCICGLHSQIKQFKRSNQEKYSLSLSDQRRAEKIASELDEINEEISSLNVRERKGDQENMIFTAKQLKADQSKEDGLQLERETESQLKQKIHLLGERHTVWLKKRSTKEDMTSEMNAAEYLEESVKTFLDELDAFHQDIEVPLKLFVKTASDMKIQQEQLCSIELRIPEVSNVLSDTVQQIYAKVIKPYAGKKHFDSGGIEELTNVIQLLITKYNLIKEDYNFGRITDTSMVISMIVPVLHELEEKADDVKHKTILITALKDLILKLEEIQTKEYGVSEITDTVVVRKFPAVKIENISQDEAKVVEQILKLEELYNTLSDVSALAKRAIKKSSSTLYSLDWITAVVNTFDDLLFAADSYGLHSKNILWDYAQELCCKQLLYRNEQLKQEKRKEEECLAEEKRKEEQRLADEKEEERLAEEKRKEEQRLAEEKQKEEERLAEEKRKEEQRLAEEKRKEEQRLADEKEEERLAEEKRKEEQRLADEKQKEEERLAEEKRKEEQRLIEEKQKEEEEERLAEEKRKKEEHLVEEKQKEELLAEEKRKKEEHLAEEKQKEEERLAEEKRKEEVRLAEEKQTEEEHLTEEKQKKEEHLAEEKQKEEECLTEEKRKKEEHLAEEKRKEEAWLDEEKRKEEYLYEQKQKEERLTEVRHIEVISTVEKCHEEKLQQKTFIKETEDKENQTPSHTTIDERSSTGSQKRIIRRQTFSIPQSKYRRISNENEFLNKTSTPCNATVDNRTFVKDRNATYTIKRINNKTQTITPLELKEDSEISWSTPIKPIKQSFVQTPDAHFIRNSTRRSSLVFTPELLRAAQRPSNILPMKYTPKEEKLIEALSMKYDNNSIISSNTPRRKSKRQSCPALVTPHLSSRNLMTSPTALISRKLPESPLILRHNVTAISNQSLWKDGEHDITFNSRQSLDFDISLVATSNVSYASCEGRNEIENSVPHVRDDACEISLGKKSDISTLQDAGSSQKETGKEPHLTDIREDDNMLIQEARSNVTATSNKSLWNWGEHDFTFNSKQTLDFNSSCDVKSDVSHDLTSCEEQKEKESSIPNVQDEDCEISFHEKQDVSTLHDKEENQKESCLTNHRVDDKMSVEEDRYDVTAASNKSLWNWGEHDFTFNSKQTLDFNSSCDVKSDVSHHIDSCEEEKEKESSIPNVQEEDFEISFVEKPDISTLHDASYSDKEEKKSYNIEEHDKMSAEEADEITTVSRHDVSCGRTIITDETKIEETLTCDVACGNAFVVDALKDENQFKKSVATYMTPLERSMVTSMTPLQTSVAVPELYVVGTSNNEQTYHVISIDDEVSTPEICMEDRESSATQPGPGGTEALADNSVVDDGSCHEDNIGEEVCLSESQEHDEIPVDEPVKSALDVSCVGTTIMDNTKTEGLNSEGSKDTTNHGFKNTIIKGPNYVVHFGRVMLYGSVQYEVEKKEKSSPKKKKSKKKKGV